MAKTKRYKIGEIAQQTGVTVNAVRHYVHEGLLPPPVKTSPNMAYYDEACIALIIEIKKLQEEYFLPLPVIKRILELRKQGKEIDIENSTFAPLNIIRDFKGLKAGEFAQRFGLTPDKLAEYTRHGLFAPRLINDELIYGPDDVLMGETLTEIFGLGMDDGFLLGFAPEIKALSDKVFARIRCGGIDTAKKAESPAAFIQRSVLLTAKFIQLGYINYSRENIIKIIKEKGN